MVHVYRLIKKSRLPRRLLVYILSCCLFLIFLSTCIQVYINYQNNLTKIHTNLDYIEKYTLPGISNSVFAIDTEQIDIQLRGILSMEGIAYVEVIEDRDNTQVRVRRGDATIRRDLQRTFPLVYTASTVQQRTFGRLTVAVSLHDIRRRLITTGLLAFAYSLIGIGAVAASIMIIFHFVLTRRIVALKEFTQKINLNALNVELNIYKKLPAEADQDELQQLTAAIESMRMRLIEGINERNRTETALLESESRYRQLFDNESDALIVFDIASMSIEDVNKAAIDLYGYSKKEFIGLSFDQLVLAPNWARNFRKNISKSSFKNSQSPVQRFKKKDGTVFKGEIVLGHFTSQMRRKAIGAVRDITERVRAAQAIETEKERLAVTLRSIGDGVISTDAGGKIVLINAVAERLTGWTQREAIDAPLGRVFHIINEKTRQRCADPVKKVLKSNRIVGLANDTVLVARDGTERIIADSGAPICDNQGNTIGVVLVFRDITQKAEIEAELRHAHKMEAVGTLAGGIAHEFNNMLGIIIGNTELALEDLAEWHPSRSYLRDIKAAGMRSRDVVRQLLSFSRKAEQRRKAVRISPTVKDAIALLRASMPAFIVIQTDIPENAGIINADPTQIHQVLINLGTNASHAMEENGGMLKISLEEVTLDHFKSLHFQVMKPGRYVQLTVSDTGTGIEPGVLERVFDPYFTTKEVGKGSGMGLSIVHGIVKNHDGAISIDSEPGKGTRVKVFFPLLDRESGMEPITLDTLPTGKESILFVDDEESLLEIGSKILERLGYLVDTQSDPLKALGLVKEDPSRYDLIITDMTMPQITGDKFTREVLKIQPQMPVIICTGFSEKIDSDNAKLVGASSYIEKPLDTRAFANAVRQVLDRI